MAEVIDSDMTMSAATTFDKIIQQIQNSGLNYQLKITPFSANISIKKSFVKYRGDYSLFSMESKHSDVYDVSNVDDRNNVLLIQELGELRSKETEYSREL